MATLHIEIRVLFLKALLIISSHDRDIAKNVLLGAHLAIVYIKLTLQMLALVVSKKGQFSYQSGISLG